MITKQEEERVIEIFEVTMGDEFHNLSEWEQNFLSDIHDKYEQYGQRLLLSQKQWAVLERIYTKCINPNEPEYLTRDKPNKPDDEDIPF